MVLLSMSKIFVKMVNFAFLPEKIFKCLTSCGDDGGSGDGGCDGLQSQEKSFLSSFECARFIENYAFILCMSLTTEKPRTSAWLRSSRQRFLPYIHFKFFCENNCLAVIFSYRFEDSFQRDGFRWRLCH